MGANPRGAAGESYAAGVLAELGYHVLDRNFHSRYGEVDIIAVKEEVICFVEVKTRRENAMVSGAQAMTRAKCKRIITTALLYLQQHPQWDLQPRFDLFSVTTDVRGKILSHDYCMGAFDGAAYEA